MKELLLKWLNGKRSFIVGSLLYKQFGSDESKKKLFAAGKNDIAEKLLLQSLQLLLEEKEIVMPKILLHHFESMPDDDDKILIALKQQWMPLYTEMNYKRHELDQYLEYDTRAAEIKRGELAMTILQLEKSCMAIWAKRDHYVKHGSLPGKSVGSNDIILDGFQAAKAIENAKTYIRQYKVKVKKNPTNEKHASMLQKYEKQLEDLTAQYGNR